MSTVLCMYSVYDHPKDYPHGFVVRRWDIGSGRAVPGPVVARGPDLESVRAQLPAGLVPIPRFENDDPVIVETWI